MSILGLNSTAPQIFGFTKCTLYKIATLVAIPFFYKVMFSVGVFAPIGAKTLLKTRQRTPCLLWVLGLNRNRKIGPVFLGLKAEPILAYIENNIC